MTGEASPSGSCACGSGLAADRCCQLAGASRAEPASDREIQAIAAALRAATRRRRARADRGAVPHAARPAGAAAAAGACAPAEGKTAAAEALLARIVRLDPNDSGGDPRRWRWRCSTAARWPRPSRMPRNAVRLAPDRRAVAQPDGHDPDRGAAAAGRRAPLSPRAGAARPAASRSCSPTSPGT